MLALCAALLIVIPNPGPFGPPLFAGVGGKVGAASPERVILPD